MSPHRWNGRSFPSICCWPFSRRRVSHINFFSRHLQRRFNGPLYLTLSGVTRPLHLHLEVICAGYKEHYLRPSLLAHFMYVGPTPIPISSFHASTPISHFQSGCSGVVCAGSDTKNSIYAHPYINSFHACTPISINSFHARLFDNKSRLFPVFRLIPSNPFTVCLVNCLSPSHPRCLWPITQ